MSERELYNSQVKNKKGFKNLRTFFYFMKGSRKTIVLSIVFMFLCTLINFTVPIVTNITIDNILDDAPLRGLAKLFIDALGGRDYVRERLYIIGIVIIFLILLVAVFSYIKRVLALDSAEKISKKIRDEMYTHVQSLPFSWHSKVQTGDIIQRATQDSDLVKRYVSVQFFEIFNLVILVTVGLIIMFTINVILALISMFFILSSVTFSTVYFSKIAKWFMITEVEEGKMTALLQENLTGLRVVRAFGKQADEERNYLKCNESYTNLWIFVGKKLGIFWGSGNMFAGIITFFIIFTGAFLSVNGNISTGDVLNFIIYNNMLIWPIRNLGRVLAETGRVRAGLTRLQEVLDVSPEIDKPNERDVDIKGDIEFKDVSFSYDNERRIINNISFSVKKGSVFGIVGSTGSGKSTIVQLINRLYDIDGGEILVDGVNINNIKKSCLRDNIGIVLQEPFLFSRNVNENLLVASGDVPKEELDKYLSIASLQSTIEGFMDGLSTMVGEKGVTLSGGQKQRIAIARTLLRKPPIVIFDDSFSAVDTETEQKIRQSIKENLSDTTVIIISHRISSLMHSDQIMVLKNGSIEAIGTHDELVADGGTYKRLYDLQSNGDYFEDGAYEK